MAEVQNGGRHYQGANQGKFTRNKRNLPLIARDDALIDVAPKDDLQNLIYHDVLGECVPTSKMDSVFVEVIVNSFTLTCEMLIRYVMII